MIQEGKPVGRSSDAMEWMEESAHGRPYDPTIAQLTFSLAAVHTTTDMLTQVIYDLCEQPELAQALREEVIEVIQEDGWKKTALYKMKLMDSVLKESQRLKPTSIGQHLSPQLPIPPFTSTNLTQYPSAAWQCPKSNSRTASKCPKAPQ